MGACVARPRHGGRLSLLLRRDQRTGEIRTAGRRPGVVRAIADLATKEPNELPRLPCRELLPSRPAALAEELYAVAFQVVDIYLAPGHGHRQGHGATGHERPGSGLERAVIRDEP